MRSIYLFFFILFSIQTQAQYYITASFLKSFGTYSVINDIKQRFNDDNNHQLKDFNGFSGFGLGFGKYSKRTLTEVLFVSQGQKRISKTPGQYAENAEVIVRHLGVETNIGYRPFDALFTIGAGANLGRFITKQSFGGNFDLLSSDYLLATNIFIDYAIKIKFLIRRRHRDTHHYLFRIRPFYQVFSNSIDLRNLENKLNRNPELPVYNSTPSEFGEFKQKFTNYGIRFSLAIPFVNASKKTIDSGRSF